MWKLASEWQNVACGAHLQWQVIYCTVKFIWLDLLEQGDEAESRA